MLGKMKKSGILSFLAAVFLLCGCSPKEEPVLAEAQIQEEADESAEEEGEPRDASDVKKTVVVHVCGQVANPGVYELPEGSRLYEAIQAAGGCQRRRPRRDSTRQPRQRTVSRSMCLLQRNYLEDYRHRRRTDRMMEESTLIQPEKKS